MTFLFFHPGPVKFGRVHIVLSIHPSIQSNFHPFSPSSLTFTVITMASQELFSTSSSYSDSFNFSNDHPSEEEKEHHESMMRIKQERAREQRELVKYMCNIPSANKHAAARAASRLGEETIMEECARSPTFATQARIAIGLEEEDCLGACSDSMSSWKRAESNRNKELAAKVVSSMDELFSTSSQEQQEDLAIRRPSLTPATPSRSSSALSYHRNMCVPTSPTTKSQASSHYSLGNEEDELEDLLCPRTIQYFSAPNSWQRTWGGQRPATPQTNTSFGRRASENDASQVSFSDRIADLKSNQRVQFHQEGLVGSESKPFERSQSSSNLLSSRLIGGRKMGERRLNMSCDRSAAPSPVGSNYSSYLFEENTNRMAKSANT